MQAKTLDKITIIYLIIPMVIFLIGWLNPLVALVSCTVLLIVVFQVFKGLLNRNLEIKKSQLILMFLIAVVWCILAGIGGLYYQSPDWHVRNAIFRDLVNFTYPVIYDNGAALVYYMGFFLPGALVGKLALLLHATPEQAFNIGNLFTLFYSSIGVALVFLQVLLLTNAKKKQYFLIILLFILFSGLDILHGKNNNFYMLFLEVHFCKYTYFQFSSNTALLFWVYNQTIAPWLLTALFLRRPYNISNYGFLASLSLFYAPLPFIGLSLYMFFMTIIRFIRQFIKRHLSLFFKDLFSIKNILSLIFLLPIFYFYYSSNLSAQSDKISFLPIPMLLLWFVLIEVGIYFIVLFNKNYKNVIYYITIFSLVFCSFFIIGRNPDFCMRVSIPALFILFVLVIKYLFDSKKFHIGKVILTLALMLGMVTPFFEFYRGCYIAFINKAEPLFKDKVVTLNNRIKPICRMKVITYDAFIMSLGNYRNYGAVNLNKHIFFKYLAKKNKNKDYNRHN